MKTFIRGTSRRGTALLVVIAIVVLIGLVAAAMHQISSQEAYITWKTRDMLKAKVIAEAGANEAYHRVKHDFAAIYDESLFPKREFGGGDYDVEFIPVGSNKARMVSRGRCNKNDATVVADLLNQRRQRVSWILDTPNADLSAFTNHAVLAGGVMDWQGGGILTNGGNVKANNLLEMAGGGTLQGPNLTVLSSQQIYIKGSARIEGDAYAPSFGGKVNQITTRHTQPVPPTPIPLIDLMPFYYRALSNNQVRSGTLINSDFSPPGGVLWVNGNLKISNGRVTGCFVATGDIDISTSRTMTPVEGFPLLISRDGNIKVTSTADMEGLIYARGGSIDWTGGGKLKGGIVAAGNFDKGGGSDLVLQFSGVPPKIPDVPVAQTNSTDYVIISAWQM